MTAAEPAVKTASAYYEANIGSVQSIQDLVGNYRLLSYALNAYGLGDQINAKGLITKVLEGGVSNPKSSVSFRGGLGPTPPRRSDLRLACCRPSVLRSPWPAKQRNRGG
jgi:hypothetical protein